MRYVLYFVTAWLLVTTTAVAQDKGILSCAEFRDKIASAIAEAGDRVAQPDLTDIAYQRTDRTLTRYALKRIEGLAGDLRCTGDDSIEVFDVMTEIPGSGSGPLHILRISYLTSAAVCAVARGTSARSCDALTKGLLDAAIRNYARAKVRGEPNPSGFEKATLKGGFEAEFHVREGQVFFSLAPPLDLPIQSKRSSPSPSGVK